jgi:hypothetical protein
MRRSHYVYRPRLYRSTAVAPTGSTTAPGLPSARLFVDLHIGLERGECECLAVCYAVLFKNKLGMIRN